MSDSSANWLDHIGSDSHSDHEAEAAESSIGPVRTGATFEYALEGCARLRLLTDNAKGLSFQIWPSALHLAGFALSLDRSTPGFWKGKLVVELGSGCGLVGLVLACLGARVLLTDLAHVLVCSAAQQPSERYPTGIIDHNIRENRQAWEGSGGCAEAAELSWGTTNVSAMGAPWSAPDFVIAADVIYDRALFQPLLSTLCAYGAGTDILLAHVRRWTSDRRFFRMLRSARFTVEDATGSLEKGGDSHASHTTVTGADGGDRRGGSLHERGACRIFRIHRTTGHSQRQQARVNGAARHKGYP